MLVETAIVKPEKAIDISAADLPKNAAGLATKSQNVDPDNSVNNIDGIHQTIRDGTTLELAKKLQSI